MPAAALGALFATAASGGEGAGSASPAPCFAERAAGTVAGHGGGVSIVLQDGRTVRLAEIVPAAPVPEARVSERLARLSGARVAVRAAAPEADRYGRIVGDVAVKATGESAVVTLLRQGLALVDPAVMSGPCLTTLFAAEKRARAARRGVWSRAGFVRDAGDADLAAEAGAYALVEGVVKSVGRTRRTLYLNFGDDYRTDFTVLVRRRDAGAWADSLTALEGRKVRVRGVLEAWHGGLIRVEHPRQIEDLGL